MNRRRRPTSPGRTRGYILLETMFAGALLAVTLSTSIDLIADARRRVSTGANRQTATSLAQRKCSELIAGLPTATADQGSLAAVDSSRYPGFRWKWTTVTPTLNSVPALSAAAREGTCTVEYPTVVGSPEDTASSGAGDGKAQVVVRMMWMDPT